VVREKKGGGSSQDEEERMGVGSSRIALGGGVKVVRCTNRLGG
jgi:hypothetical protein